MGRIALWGTAALAAATLFSAVAAPGFAGTPVQVPGSYSVNFNGTALSITNTFVSSGSAARSAAIAATASGSRGIGLLGVSPAIYGLAIVAEATGQNSVAFDGIESGSGAAAHLTLEGTSAGSSSAALIAQDAGGSATARGAYGNAGSFAISNPRNTMPAVTVGTNGIDSYGLQVVSSATSDGAITHSPSGDQGGIAGYFEIDSAAAQFGQAALLGVHSGGETSMGGNGRYGNAGRFVITNTNNFDTALLAQTKSNQGTAVEGDDFSSGGGVSVYGVSTNGTSAQFTGGSGGSGTCSYDGSSGWNCPSDRNLKEHLVAADTATVLERLDRLPVYYYQMKHSRAATRFLGPTAQDFKAAFGLGDTETKINTANAQGVALAAAKGLYERVRRDEAKLAAQDVTIAALERRLERVEARR
jgi:hypothetical protein